MFAVNKTTILKTEDVADEELKRKVEADPMATFEPHENDVLCGRGGSINNHAGNENYRILVTQKKRVYLTARFKREKRLIAASIVQSIRSLNPSGRFLQRNAKTGVWHDIGDTKARDKSSQALREGAPEIRKEIENDRKIMMSTTNNNDDDDDDDYDDVEEEEVKASPAIFKSASREGKAAGYMGGHHGTQHDMRHNMSQAQYQQIHNNVPGSHLRNDPRDRTSNHHSSPHHHHHSPSYHEHRDQRHSSNSHHSMHYDHQRDHRHPPSPLDEYRYSSRTKSSSVPAIQASKSWSTPPESVGGYTSSRAAYSRYHRQQSSSSQDQRQLNYSSSRTGGAVNLRDRPDRSPIRSQSSHNQPYYNDPNIMSYNTSKQQESYDNRHLLAPTPVQPDDGQYFDPTNGHMRYPEKKRSMHPYSNTHEKTFKQSSSWAEGEPMDNGFHADMPPPNMRLPSWDSDFASNIDNASVTGDINVFDHDVMMADTAPSMQSPKNIPAEHHQEPPVHERQIVEARVDKEEWASRVPGCFGQFMSQDWSKIFHSSSFDHGQFCGMELCGGDGNSGVCNYAIEDDPQKVIDSFNNASSGSMPTSSHHGPKQHTPQQYTAPTSNVPLNTLQDTTLKPMHTFDSELSAFGSEAGSGFSKNIEPIPFHHHGVPTNNEFVANPNIFSSDPPHQEAPMSHHYQPHPMEANYY